MAAPNERLIAAAEPIVRVMKTREDFRRAERIERAIDQQGKPIVEQRFDATWDGNNPLMLGTYHFWIEAGVLRVKNGKATSATDGVAVGGQV